MRAMTVVAIVRGAKDYNLLLADATAAAVTESEAVLRDKIVHVFGNTYATAIGDGSILACVRAVADWYHPRRPNFRDTQMLDLVVALLAKGRRIDQRLGRAQQPPLGALVFFCTRDDAYYWQINASPDGESFSHLPAPTPIAPGEALLFWGMERVSYSNFATTPTDPFGPMIGAVRKSDAQLRRDGGTSIAYPLGDRFSGVALPHKSSTDVRRVRPFHDVLEQLVHLLGDEGKEALLSDPEFMSLPMPTVT